MTRQTRRLYSLSDFMARKRLISTLEVRSCMCQNTPLLQFYSNNNNKPKLKIPFTNSVLFNQWLKVLQVPILVELSDLILILFIFSDKADMKPRFINSLRGFPAVELGGYRYNKRVERPGPKEYWRCSQRRAKRCNAQIVTLGEEVVDIKRCHNH